MRALFVLTLLAAGAPALSGCSPVGLAMTAASAAVQAATRRPAVTEDRREAARTACAAQAAPYGAVHIIDAEQSGDGRVTVWGRIDGETARRAFECRFDGRVRRFTLSEAGPAAQP